MCLNLKRGSNKILIAETDIVCYKAILKKLDEDNDYDYVTLFQRSNVSIGSTYESEFFIYRNNVEEGLHSIADKIDTEMMINGYNICIDQSEILSIFIVKCIIPKGTEYYVGLFDELKSYASAMIKYVEIVDEINII